MELIVGLLLLPLGIYLFNISRKDIKTESGWPRNAINLALFSLGLLVIGIGLIYNYFNK